MKQNGIMFVLCIAMSFALILSGCTTDIINTNGNNNDLKSSGAMKKFSSAAEIDKFLESTQQSYVGFNSRNSMVSKGAVAMDTAVVPTATSESVSGSGEDGSVSQSDNDFSTTNNQVAGVDEADIVKTDGKFIYYVSNNVVYIVDANSPSDIKILSKIKYNQSYPQEMYISGDKLIVIGNENFREENKDAEVATDVAVSSKIAPGIMPRYYYRNNAFIRIYDVSDRANPKQLESISLEGNYYNSRMIGDYAYVLVNKGIYGHFLPPVIYYGNGLKRTIEADAVSYFDMPDSSYELTMFLSVNVKDNSFSDKTVLKGYSQNMFVSENNIYLVNQKFVPYYLEEKRIMEEVVMKYLPEDIQQKIAKVNSYDLREETKLSEIQFILQDYAQTLTEKEQLDLEEKTAKDVEKIRQEIQTEREKTVINMLSVKDGKVEAKAHGEVPGTVLNQFSMDEYDGYFRIATTTGNFWSGEENVPKNNVYVLDSDLKVVGILADLAPKERIYSVRFMGERAYMVTFRNTDPLFVIDLKEPTAPKVLGKLKIPGFSTYLHPYDENHIIGIGKETEEDSDNKDIVRQQGLKMSLFDVTDVEHPIEMSKVSIGDRGSDSDALYNHKAFLFSKEKNLLVLPVRVAEIDKSKYKTEEELKWAYGDFKFQGAYVYNIDLEKGFDLKGKITHVSDDSLEKSGYYYYSDESIVRSLYIGNTLYTMSNAKIMASDLSDLSKLSSVKLDKPVQIDYPYYARGGVEPAIME